MQNGIEEWRISRVEEMANRHDKLLLIGNGKPGLTTRMQRVEDSIETIKFYGRWILLLCAGILITAVVELVVKR